MLDWWKEPLRIGISLAVAALGLLILPDKHSTLIFKATGKAAFGEYIVQLEGDGVYVARNSSSDEVSARLTRVENWMIHVDDTAQPLEGQAGAVPPSSQAVAILPDLPTRPRLVRQADGQLVKPGELIIATEHEDAIRFSLLVIVLSLVGLVVLVATSYVFKRNEDVQEDQNVRNSGRNE